MITIPKLTEGRTKERCVHIFELFSSNFKTMLMDKPQEKKTTVDETLEDEESTGNDSESDSEDVPVSVTTMGSTKKMKSAMTPKQNVRRQTAPPQLLVPTSGVSINNYGPGTVANNDVGNIRNSTISNVGNNNSKNYYRPRPKKTFPGYGY